MAFNLSKHAVKNRRYPPLAVGDRVRGMLKQDGKRKGYEPKWSVKLHTVIFARDGGYLVDDLQKRMAYHRHELLKVLS